MSVDRTFTLPGGLRAFTHGLGLRQDDDLVIGGDGVRGWDSAPSMRRDTIDRPNSPGAFRVPGYLAARVITLSGSAHSPSPQELNHLRRRLTGVLAAGGEGILAESGDFGTWWTRVSRAGTDVEWDVAGLARRDATWQIQFLAADPRKYGEEHTFTASPDDPAMHAGNITAAPVLTITGDRAEGYTIGGPEGLHLVVLEPLLPGSPHRIDMRDGSLRIDGETVAGGLASPTTWGVPPGIPVVHTITPGATLTGVVLDTDI